MSSKPARAGEPAMSDKLSFPTQGLRWHEFYNLLNTTNFQDDLTRRKKIARGGSVRELRETYIEHHEPSKHNWGTRRMPLARLAAASLEGVGVGTAVLVPLKDCLLAVAGAVEQVGLREPDSVFCDLKKLSGEAVLFVTELRRRQAKLIDRLRSDEVLRKSEAVVSPVGKDTLKIVWFIPLKRIS